jgi:hypothetical protein
MIPHVTRWEALYRDVAGGRLPERVGATGVRGASFCRRARLGGSPDDAVLTPSFLLLLFERAEDAHEQL